MAIYVKTDRPRELVNKIRDGIENHTIETWLCDGAGDFTHDTDQWRYHAWMTPYFEEERVVFGILCRKDRNLSITDDEKGGVSNLSEWKDVQDKGIAAPVTTIALIISFQ